MFENLVSREPFETFLSCFLNVEHKIVPIPALLPKQNNINDKE